MNRLPRWLLTLLAVTAGVTVANIYYCQPLLGVMAATFHTDADGATAIATATQLGYASGLLLIVPLADSFERKGLLVGTTLLSALALGATALAPSVRWLTATGYATGAISVMPPFCVTFATGLAAPERRGRTVGLVMSGLLVGILLSRTLSGVVATHAGWRTVYWLAAGLMLLLAATLAVALPPQTPARRVPYTELLTSLWRLVRTEPVLRRHAAIGALGFGAFSAFWTTLAFHLANLPGHYGSETAGLFGLVGAAGALAAAAGGTIGGTDRATAPQRRGTRVGRPVVRIDGRRPRLALVAGTRGGGHGCRGAGQPHLQPDTRLRAFRRIAQPPQFGLHGHLLPRRRARLGRWRAHVDRLRLDRRLRHGHRVRRGRVGRALCAVVLEWFNEGYGRSSPGRGVRV